MVCTVRAWSVGCVLALLVAGCSSGGAKESSPVTAMQPTATTACTLADLQHAGSAPMPHPASLGRPATFTDYGVRLDPPPVGAQPSVSAGTAWHAARIKSPEGSYQLLLASYTSPYPSKNPPADFSHVLAWVVIGRNVPLATLPAIVPPALPGRTEPRTSGATQRPCMFDFALDAFDANTGKELVLTQLVCRVSLGHHSRSVVVRLAKGSTADTTIGPYTMRFSIVTAPGADGLGTQRNTLFGPPVSLRGKDTIVVGGGEGYFRPTANAFGGSSTTGNGTLAYNCGA